MSSSLAGVLTTLLGGRAFAERHGESPAKVVALHGWGRTRADWNATLQGYDALAIDLPGFGATPAPDSGWSTSEYAVWVGECLDEVVGSGGERPVLVGHSFGGRVAVRLAATNPELVRGIVLTGVPLLRPETAAAKPAFGFRALRFLNKWHFISNDVMEKERRKRGSADYRAAEGEMREVLVKAVNEDYGDALDALASNGLPVAMVWGEHDTAATTAMAERARARIGAHADLEVVPGSAHLLDEALVAALRRAIDDLAARP
jgi:pimeloyl-ACP methyl ester carboxylesterase